MADTTGDDEKLVEDVPKKKGGLCKIILRFLGSNVGLFIVLTY